MKPHTHFWKTWLSLVVMLAITIVPQVSASYAEDKGVFPQHSFSNAMFLEIVSPILGMDQQV